MSDDLSRRMTDQQLAMARTDLTRTARQFADTATQYADSVHADRGVSDGARRLVQEAADLLQAAARLDGMRDLAALVPDGEES